MPDDAAGNGQKRLWLSKILGVELPPAGPLTGETAPEGDVRARLTAVGNRLKELKGQPGTAELVSQLTQAVMALRAGDGDKTARLVGSIEQALKTLPTATGKPPRPPVDAEAFRREWRAALSSWQAAVDTVDGQMAQFANALRGTGDPWLERIADFGLMAVTANHKVKLMAACLGVAGPNDAGVAKARQAIDAFASHISTSDKVAACDENDLGIPVAIRATLAPALKGLTDALGRGA